MSSEDPGTRQRILESACRAFAEKGYRGATVADICEAAGTNIASVNYHFGDKERLYDAVWRFAFQQASAAFPIEPAFESDLPAEERLRLIVHVLSKRTLSQGVPGYYARLQTREMVEPTGALEDMVRDVVIPQRRMLVAVVRELLGDGIPESAVDLCALSIASQGLFLSVSAGVRAELARQREFEDQTIEAFADHITDFSLAGIKDTRRRFEGERP